MFHFSRSALAVVASIGLVAAAGCGGSSATPTPTPISDPNLVITQAVEKTANVTSLHIKIDVTGKVNTSSLSGGSSGGIGLGGNIDLAGTNVEGDIDVAKQAVDLKLAVPGLLGTTGEIIVVNGFAYYKISLMGDKFTKAKLSDLTGGLPVSVPTALPSGSGAIIDQVEQLRQQLKDAGVTTQLMPDDKVDGKDAYHIAVNLPLDKINALLAGEGGSTAAGMKLDSASADIWTYKDSNLPAKFEIKGSAATLGNLDVVITLTNYNQPVTIAAPPDSQIQPAAS